MASAHHDQAEGLRRQLVAPLPGLCTVLSADDDACKAALMHRLAASMSRRGAQVLLLGDDVIAGLTIPMPTLRDVAHGRASLADASQLAAGFRCMQLGAGGDDPALARLLQQLAAWPARVLVDARLDEQGRLPLSLLADGELVVQLSGSDASVCSAYAMLRALKDQCARGSVSLLVTAADPAQARRVRANLFQAASRYLALALRSIVPQESFHV